jgi:hypothetical protein
MYPGDDRGSQVRRRLAAGGNRIRTIGSAGKGPTVSVSVSFRSDFSVAGNRPESTINGVHLLENLKLDELVGQERRRICLHHGAAQDPGPDRLDRHADGGPVKEKPKTRSNQRISTVEDLHSQC